MTSFVWAFCEVDGDYSGHLYIKECDQDMDNIPEARLGSKVGCAGGHIASIKDGVRRGHESKAEEPDIVGQYVYIDEARREGEPEEQASGKDDETKNRYHVRGQV
jgi:hypothetical protein